MSRATALLLIVVVFTTGTAEAGQTTAPPKPKSPATATGLALLGIAIPVSLVALAETGSNESGSDGSGLVLLGLVGSIFGPGLGHSYAGDSGRFWRGAGLRTLAWGGAVAAVAMSWDNESDGANLLAVSMAALYLFSTVLDIATASDSADRYNERLKSHEVTLAPLWVPRDRAVGLGASWSF